jgi:hypothetical protein
MIYTLIKCWHIKASAFDLDVISSASPTLQLLKKSILKNGYRAFYTDERKLIANSDWYKDFLMGEKVFFYIDGSGMYRLVNIDLSENELYFEKDNLPAGYKPWIFYSWQSDHNSSRSHIKDALVEIIKHINDTRNPKLILELVEATRPEDGVKDIPSAIKEKIDKCLFSFFDITNVSTVNRSSEQKKQSTKSYPNANVVFELSYALHRKRIDQIVFVKKKRNDFDEDLVPFDFEHYKRLDYDKPAILKEELKTIIINAFERFNFISNNLI